MACAVAHERQSDSTTIDSCVETIAARSTPHLVEDQRSDHGSHEMAAQKRVKRSLAKIDMTTKK
jgi:hypothetical protein